MKKNTDEWFKNKTWNGKIDSNFEDHFKRTRSEYSKAEYLQIQGACLLDNPQKNIQEVGIALLTRLLEDFPLEHNSVILAKEKLGDYYLQQGDCKQANHFFKAVNDYCMEQNSRGGTSGMADLKLAATILKFNEVTDMETAYQCVMNYPVVLLNTNKNKFYYAQLAASICSLLDKKEEAKAFANNAIEISISMQANFDKQKNKTAENAQALLVKTMETIINT